MDLIVETKDSSTGKKLYGMPSYLLHIEELEALIEEAREIIRKANGNIGDNIGSRDAYLDSTEFPR